MVGADAPGFFAKFELGSSPIAAPGTNWASQYNPTSNAAAMPGNDIGAADTTDGNGIPRTEKFEVHSISNRLAGRMPRKPRRHSTLLCQRYGKSVQLRPCRVAIKGLAASILSAVAKHRISGFYSAAPPENPVARKQGCPSDRPSEV